MAVLRQLDILDTSAEAAFDHFADWGRRTFGVPICIVTLVDANRQWFKACYGLDARQTDRDSAFCAHAIMPGAPDVLEVPDTLADARFAKNDIAFIDPTPTDHDGLGQGLKKGLYNFMHGIGLDHDIRSWFPVRVPKTTVPRRFIERALTAPR